MRSPERSLILAYNARSTRRNQGTRSSPPIRSRTHASATRALVRGRLYDLDSFLDYNLSLSSFARPCSGHKGHYKVQGQPRRVLRCRSAEMLCTLTLSFMFFFVTSVPSQLLPAPDNLRTSTLEFDLPS